MKLLFVIGLALFARSNAFPTPKSEVPKQCADPTFACQDLDSARACGVVKDCINDIWATMSVPDDNDEVCDICKEMVKEARDQLLSNMTQEELKEVFEGSCELLGVKLVVDACKKLCDSFIPQLVEFLTSRMDPNMVCHLSGMCFVSDKKAVENDFQKYVKMILDAKTPDECKQCTTLVVDLQTFMKSSSETFPVNLSLSHEDIAMYENNEGCGENGNQCDIAPASGNSVIIRRGKNNHVVIVGGANNRVIIRGGSRNNIVIRGGAGNKVDLSIGKDNDVDITGGGNNNVGIKDGSQNTVQVPGGAGNRVDISRGNENEVRVAGGHNNNVSIRKASGRNVDITGESNKNVVINGRNRRNTIINRVRV